MRIRIRRIAAILWLMLIVAQPLLASEEIVEEQPGSSVFEGTPAEAAWTLLWFLVLLIVLWKLAWKPLLAGLSSRQEYIEKQISDAEKIRTDAKKALDEYGAKLADADRQGRDIITTRTKEAEKQAQEVIRKNQKDIEQMKVRTSAELERERFEVEEDLWGQAGDIIRRLGEEVFGKALTDADNQKLIDEAIARLKKQEQG